MKNIIILSLLLIPFFACAQYPSTGNKQRLGWQTTGDGLIWRGVAGDTVNKPNNRNYPYFQLDTVNSVLYRYVQTRGQWQPVSASADIDSLIYATRFWVNSNFFPLQGGTLTGTGGNGFINFPLQSSPPVTPSTGFSLYAGSTGNNISWMQPDGFFRRLVSPVTGTPRQYQFMARSYTLADSADVAALPTGSGITDRSARWSSSTALAAGNITDNGTKLQALLPWQFHSWTTAGRPTGATGYTGLNTTTGFTEGYFTSQWENYITSTGGSNGQVSIFSSAGKTYGTNNLFWDNTNTRLGLGTASPAHLLDGLVNANGFRGYNITNSSTGVAAIAGFLSTNNAGSLFNFGMSGSNYTNIAVIGGSSGFLNATGSGGIAIYANNTAATIRFATNQATVATEVARFSNPGNLLLGTTTDVTGYKLNIVGTGAIGLPRGTVAQRPTIASSTTPFRYNTDSTALEYGESVGTWRQLATRDYARSLVPTTLYTGDGTIPSGTTRTVSVGMNGDEFSLSAVADNKAINKYLSSTDGNADVNSYQEVVTNSSKFKSSTDYNAAGIYDGANSYIEDYFFAERDALNHQVIKLISSQIFSSTNTNRARFYNMVDSVNLSTISASNIRVQNSATPKTHWAGLIDNSYGNGGWGNQTARFISFSPSWKVQTNIFNSDTYFDWLRVDNLDTDTTSNRLSFYNNKYVLPNARPATGSGVKQSLVWTGTGSAATPAFEYVKKDTTIYVTDADYNFSAAITSANILLKFNRIIIYSKLTSGASSDNQIFLHSASSDFLQCEIIIYSNDASADSDATSIDFTTNGAVDGTGGTVSSYGMSAGQRVNIRAVDDGGYKWIYN